MDIPSASEATTLRFCRETAAVKVPVVCSDRSHILDCDLVVGKVDMLDLDGSPTSLMGPFVVLFLALPFHSSGSARRF